MPAISTARSLTFTIAGNPPVLVTAVENNGKIDFTVDVQDTTKLTGDLRGFFFDMPDGKLTGMKVTSSDAMLTQSKVAKDAVLDLGNGDTMAAKTTTKFDVGMEWGTTGKSGTDDISYAVKFTLSNTANNLTLDDIAGQRFGAKVDSIGAVGTARTTTETIIGTASAAPDAKDDVFTIKEDGAGQTSNAMTTASTGSPVTKAVTLAVLANDTDGDRDPLTIIGLGDQPQHGTVSISADGKSLAYTPVQNYSGTDTFQYGVSDGKGGIDYAKVTVNITPVADVPVISFSTSAGASVNQTIIHVTASVTDLDGSEVISAITAGSVAAGISLTAMNAVHAVVGQAGTYAQDYVLNLPKDQSNHFDLGFSATSKEVANGVTASIDATTPISYDYHTQTDHTQFNAVDQSMWQSGAEYNLHYSNFFGINSSSSNRVEVDFGVGDIYAGADTTFKAGLQLDLNATGGRIDAAAVYDITVASATNHTTDTLQIDTSSVLDHLSVNTLSPEGTVALAAVFEAAVKLYVGFHLGVDVPVVGFVGAEDESTLVDFDHGGSYTIFNGSSDGAQTSVALGKLSGLSLDFAWPTISTQADGSGSSLSNSGTSQNFLTANVDVDQFLTKLIGLPDFLSAHIGIGPVSLDAILYDATLKLGADFKQDFMTALGALTGTITLENGATRDFTVGDSLTFANASSYDTNHDGNIAYSIDFAPHATVHNQTAVGFNLDYDQTIGKLDGNVDLSIGAIDIIDEDFSLGPLYHGNYHANLGAVNVYDSTFDLQFQHQKMAYFA